MKSKFKMSLIALCICFVTISCKNNEEYYSEQGTQHQENHSNSEELNTEYELTYVYITDTGSKYHREMCISLKYSKIKCTLEEAEQKGLRECKICRPVSYK